MTNKNPYGDLEELNKHLSQFSYVCGYMPCKIDVETQSSLGSKLDFQKYPYIKRWWYHMRSFNDSERSQLPERYLNYMISKKNNKISIDQQVGSLL